MTKTVSSMRTLACCCLIAIVTLSLSVSAEDKPSLADEMRQVLNSEGPAAGMERFNEIFPDRQHEYEIDMSAMANLGQEYMVAGDMERGMAVMEMTASLAGAVAAQMSADTSIDQGGGTSELIRQMQEQEQQAQAMQAELDAQAREEEAALREQARRQSMGKARDDLRRFAGLYADPGDPDRRLYVNQSCDGYLVVGAMWGDAAPWSMRSAADKVFTYSGDYMSFSMEFQADGDGKIRGMAHELDFIGSPLQRSGPLPAGWKDCVEATRY